MKKFLSLFTHNWGTKLLAAALAIAVFYWVRGMKSTPGSTIYQMKGPSNANAAR